MILVLLPFCFCQLPDSFLLRLDVANHRPHSFAHQMDIIRCPLLVQSPFGSLRGAPFMFELMQWWNTVAILPSLIRFFWLSFVEDRPMRRSRAFVGSFAADSFRHFCSVHPGVYDPYGGLRIGEPDLY